jgi:Kef-type K+ transport system membrane component KefB
MSGLLTGVIFGVVFGPEALNVLHQNPDFDLITTVSIFMLLFYFGLTKPSGEFFRKFVMSHKMISFPTVLSIPIIFALVSYYEYFDTAIALILVIAFGSMSVSVNSVTMRYMKNHELFKEDVFRIFLAKAIPNNTIVVFIFVSLLALFDLGDVSTIGVSTAVGSVALFTVISFVISRYLYPRVATYLKNNYLIISLLLLNAMLQSTIAVYMDLHFIIGVFLSNLFIPELFLKAKNLDPIRKKTGVLNGYLFVPIFGLAVGLNIDVGILFDYDLFLPFLFLASTIIVVQYILSIWTLKFEGVSLRDTTIITFGTFAKTELAIIVLLFSVNYGAIDGEIFTSSIILLGFLNLLAWYTLGRIDLKR